MKVKTCAFFHKSNGTCNLITETQNNGFDYSFIPCEKIAINRCPYKLYIKGEISKEKLNEMVKGESNDRI